MAYSHIHTQAHRHPRAFSLLEARSILHLSDQHPKSSYGDTTSHSYGDTASHGHGDTTSHGYVDTASHGYVDTASHGHGDLYASPASCG